MTWLSGFVRTEDVKALHELLRASPKAEYNIEGNPFHNLMDSAWLPLAGYGHRTDSEGQFTSDHGWNLPADAERLGPVIAQAKAVGVRVSLFMDPLPEAMAQAKAIGADRVELYTESYASAWGTPARPK